MGCYISGGFTRFRLHDVCHLGTSATMMVMNLYSGVSFASTFFEKLFNSQWYNISCHFAKFIWLCVQMVGNMQQRSYNCFNNPCSVEVFQCILLLHL